MASAGGNYFLAGVCCCIAILIGTVNNAWADSDVDPAKVYQLVYEATLDPGTGHAHVSMSLTQHRQLVRSVSLLMPEDRYLNVRPTSQFERSGDRVIWRPLKKGSTLHFDFLIDHQRPDGARDARITDTWALLKLDHLFPGATTRVIKGASSEASLKLVAPQGWSIETPYGWGTKKTFDVSNPHRRFDQPRGWLLAGELGVRRERISGRHVSVASPLGTGLRANDLLAFLRWTLPSLVDIFPDFPNRMLVVSGSQDMWRGGLSGRASLYIHPDRPLISGNRTSAVLHELFHVASGLRAKTDADWIVEGLAEYYSLTLLLRSDGISQFRYNKSFDALARWSAATPCVAKDRSQGKHTARAALVMRALDAEIRTKSGDEASLDTLVQNLVQSNRTITSADFRSAAKRLTNGPVRTLSDCP
jgi:predicted metalloprotease with PDZ domain